jgi:hypothetical protein
MAGALIALAAIAIGLGLGWLFFQMAGEASPALNSFFGVLGRVAWIIIGVAAIIGGMVVLGVILISLGVFLGLGHWMILKDSDIRRKIAGG